MSANAALDIAIALVLMYLVLSLIGTVVNEFIATKMKLRANTLQSAVQSMIDNATLRGDFYNHGLIDGTNDAIEGEHVSYIAGSTFAMALISSLDTTKPLPGFTNVKSAVENLPDCNIRDVLLAELGKAGNDLDKFRTGIATYFDNVMDRVGGLYKRNMKWISLAIGFVIVIALNADSVSVSRALWKDSALRDQMAQDAQKFVATAQTGGGAGAPQAAADIGQTEQTIARLEQEIRPLPIGWPDRNFSPLSKPPNGRWTWYGALWIVLIKAFGLVMTALAVSLGAPFWFDLLGKFMNLRGAGVPPKRTAQSH
jgi:hypothetical protein